MFHRVNPRVDVTAARSAVAQRAPPGVSNNYPRRMTTAAPPPSPPPVAGEAEPALGHPGRATVDLLGVLAYGELSAFDRLPEDARQAPTLAGRAALSAMAAAEIGHFRLLEEHLAGMGIPVEHAMLPFVAQWDAYHASTRPRSRVASSAPSRS